MTDNTEENEYPQNAGNGSMRMTAYTVEARLNTSEPREIAGRIFDKRWRKVHFDQAKVGVPIASPLHLHEFRQVNVMEYSSAQALRWWLHAIADTSSIAGGLCLETKLVKHKIESTYKCEAVSDHKLISGEDRSNCMPDWGTTGG